MFEDGGIQRESRRQRASRPAATKKPKMKKSLKLAKVTFSGESPVLLPFRHFCGGSSIKLPLDKADFRRQWVPVRYPRANGGKFTVGRHEDVWVEFPTCENSVSL